MWARRGLYAYLYIVYVFTKIGPSCLATFLHFPLFLRDLW